MDVELEQLTPAEAKPGPSEASLHIEGESEGEDDPKADASEDEKKSEDEEKSEEEDSDSEESDDDSSFGEDETDAPMLLEQDIIDAIKKGEKDTVEQWLKKEETKVNEFRGGTASHSHFSVARGTALHWAAYYGQLEIAQLLIDNGADPRQRARGKETVLLWACQCLKENKELLKLLLTSDEPPGEPRPAGERLVNLCDYNGWTPLHYACYDDNKELLEQLLEGGADPNARNDDNSIPLDLLDEDSEEMFDLLDKDRLLPRKSDPDLGEHIIETIENSKEKEFRQWLDRESEEVNHYRGGFASGGGFVVQDGTPLHWAAYYGSFAIAKMLVEEGADPRVLNEAKEGVLHWAGQSQKENEEVVKLILGVEEKKVDVNFADDDGYTALHYACQRGYRKIAELLLGADADVTARNQYGETPVDSAFRSGNKEMIELLDKDRLLPRDDDPKLKNFVVDAIRNGREHIVQEWLKKKPELNRCRGGKVDSGTLEVSYGTALHWAAFYGRIEIAELLLESEASPHVMDKAGETVLHWACKSEQENDEMVKKVLEKIADEDAERKVNATNSSGCTALHYACWRGHQKVAETLRKAHADPNAKSSAGYTPLDFAFVVAESKGVVEMLDRDRQLPREDNPTLEEDIVEAIKRGDRDVVDKWLKRERNNVNRSRGGSSWSFTARYIHEGGTALHWAAYYGQQDIAKLLMDNDANPRARAQDNGTVLHWACTSEKENKELVRLLLSKGCKIDARDEDGNTPIHLAASQGHRGIVEELIQHDRPCVKHRVLAPQEALKAKVNKGPTPLRSASHEGHHDVVKLLVKKGAKVEPQDLKAAIEEGNQRVVSDLLQSPQWPTLMRQRWGKTTPFRELIKKMPDVAKQVLDRCVVSDPSTRDPKNKEFSVVFDYSFVEDHQERRARSSTEEATEPKVYPEEKKKAHEARFREIKEQPKKNFTTKYGPPFKKSNHPLAIMVQYERLDLLTHPVISSLLHHKWFVFGLWGYLLNLLVYAVFLVFLTSFALIVLNPRSTTCMQVLGNPGITVCEQMEGVNGTGEFTAGNGSETMANDTTGDRNVTCVTCELSGTRSNYVFAAAVIVIILAGIRLLLEASQFWYQLKSYLTDWVNWIEISLYILSIIFVSVFGTTCLCPQGWQWQVGVMAILLAWIDLIVICSKFPSIGIYVIMFARIVGTFLKVIFLSILLVVTFGLTLYMTFSEPFLQRSPFGPPGIAFLKIMSMTAGDFSFDTVFRRSPSGESEGAQEILFPPISYILWVVFVILMPVLFTNLLVGLAVGDIQKIEQEAKLKKLALQVELILIAEDLLRLTGSHKRFISGRKTVKPNYQTSVHDDLDEIEEESNVCVSACLRFIVSIYYGFQEFKYQLWGGERYDTLESLQDALNSHLDSEEAQKEDLESEDQKEKPKDEAQAPDHVEALGSLEKIMSRMAYQIEEMSERMEALEELIKETSAKKQGVEGSDSKRESEVGGDSESEGSEDESDSDN